MGGKYSICARKLTDKTWVICDYHSPLVVILTKWIYCLVKYDVVSLEKHWSKN